MKSIRIFLIGYFFSFGLYFSQNCLAKEWYFQPSAHFRTLYNDNIRLFADTPKTQSVSKDAWGFISTASANMGVRSDQYDIGLNASGVINRYISNFNLKSDNIFLNAHSTFKVNEKNQLSLNGGYSDDTTLRSLIDSTGLSQENIQRTRLQINPEWIYALSKAISIQVDYTHADISYGPQALATFSDYITDSGSIALSHQWNALLKYHINLSALALDTPDLNSTTNYYDSNVGVDYNFSDTWTALFEVGVYTSDAESDVNGVTEKASTVGPLFAVRTKKTFETSSLEVGYSRSAKVRGFGSISLYDSAFFVYSQNLSDRYRIAVNAAHYEIQGLNNQNDINSFGNTTNLVGASTTWIINPQFDLTASYQYRVRDSGNQTADSNAVYLYLNYNWNTFSTSKF